jgi:hypothetical protein
MYFNEPPFTHISEPKHIPSSFTILPDKAATNQMQKESKGWSLTENVGVWQYIHTDRKRESLKGHRLTA